MKPARGRVVLAVAVAVAAGCGGELVPIHKQPGSAPPLVCADHAECGIDPQTLQTIPCTGFGEECFALTQCAGARCVEPAHACEWQCGGKECAVMKIFPAQLYCQ